MKREKKKGGRLGRQGKKDIKKMHKKLGIGLLLCLLSQYFYGF